MISLAFDLDFLEGSYFQSFSRLFSLFFFFCMDQSQNIFDGSNTGCTLPSGQGAYRDLWWRPVTELREATGGSDTVDTSAELVSSVSVNSGCLYLGHLSKSAQFPTHRAPVGGGMDASSSNDSSDRRTCIKGDAVDRC